MIIAEIRFAVRAPSRNPPSPPVAFVNATETHEPRQREGGNSSSRPTLRTTQTNPEERTRCTEEAYTIQAPDALAPLCPFRLLRHRLSQTLGGIGESNDDLPREPSSPQNRSRPAQTY
ncbi:hypothetical protein CSUB01_06000 [Colletotrichum sublineola]|uniref:Uncharacterized protein n=1 Tax=Colletotrichum sublineola TaxID=1173701 RepID=A0A066XKT8_COLSU|nr:hypothetical protein CSUB01_06000 [Colletotrichum sublineola]